MIASLLLSLLFSAASPAEGPDSLVQAFQNPSRAARPYVWWHWMDGEVSLEGIRKDLLWMDSAGIAGFHQFDAGGVNMPKAAPFKRPYLTDSWKEAFRYAIALADSLGMEVTVASAPGWSSTGGPWVSPEDAMKKLEWQTVDVRGGDIDLVLPELSKITGQYKDVPYAPEHVSVDDYGYDVAVVAVKLPEGDMSMDQMGADVSREEASVTVSFPRPRLIKSLTVKGRQSGFRPREGEIYTDVQLQSSTDGKSWKQVCRIRKSPFEYVTMNIPPTRARYFRLTGAGVEDMQLYGVRKIEMFEEKAGYCFPYDFNRFPTAPIDNEKCIRAEEVVILTGQMSPDGRLVCRLPEGKWRIYRFGASLTGKMNHPASPNATGLEVDKLDKGAWSRYFHTYLDMYKDAAGGMLGPRGITHLLVDSYEAKSETWSPSLPEEFKRRRGYDLIPWMPVLAGEIIGDAQKSERFLQDWRKTLGELFTENYARIGEYVAEYGMKGTYIESHESGRAFVGDGMDAKRAASVPMAAIWMTDSPSGSMLPASISDIRESASVAHIYGQNIAAAESFTVSGDNKKAYTYYPENIKPVADMALASGLNRFVVHDSASQPSDDFLPGLGLFKYGQWFHRNETWASYAKVWTDYLARSCQMMQAGRNVADILVFYGEDTNATAVYGGESFRFLPRIPFGFNFDYASPDVLLNRVRVQDGCLVTDSGQKYAVLMMGRTAKVTSADLQSRIAEFRAAGVRVIGEDEVFPETLTADVVFPEGAVPTRMYGDASSAIPVNERGYETTLVGIQFVHREVPGKADIYWLRNFTGQKQAGTVKFRTQASHAALFNPETGEATALDCSDAGGGYTAVPYSLAPGDAMFYVLTETPLGVPAPKAPGAVKKTQVLDRYWDVEFVQKGGERAMETFSVLNDWTSNSDPVVKYFSGTAHYTTHFNMDSLDGLGQAWIDLGEVNVMAELIVNGHPAGVLWRAPFVSADILPFLKEGDNKLEVNVTNLWVNRMIGDRQKNAEPVTRIRRFYEAGDRLLPSGLLGPVTITLW
ncbi:MAG: discoidin domain-containing protein [Bacteroidales bacterium]|nr:discoidin domain-containing protein [Bacteroidales bacterium]